MGALCSSPPEAPPNPTHVDLTHFTLLKVVGSWTHRNSASRDDTENRSRPAQRTSQWGCDSSFLLLLFLSPFSFLCPLYSALSLGKGGFGKVNAIQRRENNELMALKRMSKAEVIKKESHIRMVWTERDIMARLHSPFLVSLIHSFQDDKVSGGAATASPAQAQSAALIACLVCFVVRCAKRNATSACPSCKAEICDSTCPSSDACRRTMHGQRQTRLPLRASEVLPV